LDRSILLKVAKLRVCIGFLGQGDQYAWWPSLFFSVSSSAFLDPVFSKTSLLSSYYGTKEAATLMHDRHIGIGKGVFHLFRQPEKVERDLHLLLEDNATADEVQILATDKDIAVCLIEELAGEAETGQVGPVRVGDTREMEREEAWKLIAGYYLNAFQNSTRIFPYFSEVK